MKHFVILKPQATSFNCPSDLNIFYSRHKWKWKLFKLAGFTSCPTKVKVLTNLTFGHKPIDRGGKRKSHHKIYLVFFQPGFHWLTQGLNLTAASELEIWGTCDHFPDFTPHQLLLPWNPGVYKRRWLGELSSFYLSFPPPFTWTKNRPTPTSSSHRPWSSSLSTLKIITISFS